MLLTLAVDATTIYPEFRMLAMKSPSPDMLWVNAPDAVLNPLVTPLLDSRGDPRGSEA